MPVRLRNAVTLNIEIAFSRLINIVVKGRPSEDVQQQWIELRKLLIIAPMIESGSVSHNAVTCSGLVDHSEKARATIGSGLKGVFELFLKL